MWGARIRWSCFRNFEAIALNSVKMYAFEMCVLMMVAVWKQEYGPLVALVILSPPQLTASHQRAVFEMTHANVS